MKRVLILASVASMIDQFNIPNIRLLQEIEYIVDVACNFKEGNTCSEERVENLKYRLKKMRVHSYQIDFSRDINNIKANIKAFWQVEALLRKNNYEFLHCHSPIGGVVGRLAGKKTHTKVIYTAHGFHFYNGAPLKNWIFYYPVEKLLSLFTDVLITINHEDYNRARNKFYMKKVEYIPGVGVDTKRFKGCTISKEEKRRELSIPENAFVLLSVGELSDRKNHKVVLNALAEINDEQIYYVIAGKGECIGEYREIIKNLQIETNVLILGARDDIDELCVASDVFVHPSIREGLGIAPLEGMAAGLPLISSFINGIKDYTEDGRTGCCITDPTNLYEMANAIIKMRDDFDFRHCCGEYNRKVVEKFDIHISEEATRGIYEAQGGITT